MAAMKDFIAIVMNRMMKSEDKREERRERERKGGGGSKKNLVCTPLQVFLLPVTHIDQMRFQRSTVKWGA